MSFDDEDYRQPPEHITQDVLETMSIEELQKRITGLEAEIVRAREVIAAKQAHRGDADSVFKT